jgi:signal transduction histidine kinase
MDAGHSGFPAVNPTLAQLTTEEVRALVPAARSAAAGELAAGVAHELNNPLFAMLGLAELLLADTKPGSAAAERLELLRTTGFEMRDAIRALVRFVRPPEAGTGPPDLADGARAAVDLFRRTSAARRLELDERYPADPVPVDGDAAALEQIVLHLLLEARRAIGEVGAIELELTREGGKALLRVRDDGAEPRPEAGLGLLAARLLAAEQGGSLEAEGPGLMLLRLPSP